VFQDAAARHDLRELLGAEALAAPGRGDDDCKVGNVAHGRIMT
jgi:hypothetical protein